MSPRSKVQARHAARAEQRALEVKLNVAAFRRAKQAIPTPARLALDVASAPALYDALASAKEWLRPGAHGGVNRWIVGVWIYGSILFGLTDEQLRTLKLEGRAHNARVISKVYWEEMLQRLESEDARELERGLAILRDLRKPLKEIASAVRKQLRAEVMQNSPATAKGLRRAAWGVMAARRVPLQEALLWFVEGVTYDVKPSSGPPLSGLPLNTHHVTHYVNGGSVREEVEDAIRRAYQARAGSAAWTWEALSDEARALLDRSHAAKVVTVCACLACELARGA